LRVVSSWLLRRWNATRVGKEHGVPHRLDRAVPGGHLGVCRSGARFTGDVGCRAAVGQARGWPRCSRAGIERIVGLRLRGETLWIDPCVLRAWPGYEMTLRYLSSRYESPTESLPRRRSCRSSTTEQPTDCGSCSDADHDSASRCLLTSEKSFGKIPFQRSGIAVA
jgi:hypothetical protein